MKISTKAQYGLRAMVYLASHYQKSTPISLKKIAQAEKIPFDYLEKIMGCLEHGGFVAARKGAQGGYFLARHPRHTRLGKIVRILEGEFSLVKCIQPRHFCPQEHHCRTKGFWRKIQQALNSALDSLTLADLTKK